MINKQGNHLNVELLQAPNAEKLEKMINNSLKDNEETVQDIQYNHSVIVWPDAVVEQVFSAMIIWGGAPKYS